MKITLNGTDFLLLPEKAMYQPESKLLLLADLHLGKTHHFRKEGLPISADAFQDDYRQLYQLLERYMPEKVYFLGDLFHSHYNNEWFDFELFIQSFPDTRFTLIKGNHDRIPEEKFQQLGIEIIPRSLEENGILYSHKPMKAPQQLINIAAHIHPGIRLYGPARQTMTVPCFYYSGNTFILPAFGKLTGLYLIDKKQGDVAYAIFPGKVERF